MEIADGAEKVYVVSRHALARTEKGTVSAAKYTAKETKTGVAATIHFIEHDGIKIVHFITHHFAAPYQGNKKQG